MGPLLAQSKSLDYSDRYLVHATLEVMNHYFDVVPTLRVTTLLIPWTDKILVRMEHVYTILTYSPSRVRILASHGTPFDALHDRIEPKHLLHIHAACA